MNFALQMLALGPSALLLLIWEVQCPLIVFFTEFLVYAGQCPGSFESIVLNSHFQDPDESPPSSEKPGYILKPAT